MKIKSKLRKSLNKIVCGDCLDVLRGLPDNCINLIVTSPPYADSRKEDYGGVHPDEYAEWLLPRMAECFRVLKPTGTLVLNIKEKVVNGERHTYVIDLISGMRDQGWLWTEEFIWHKKNSFPGKWPNRLRDAWERCLQFNKMKKFRMYQDAVKVPIGKWAETRLKNMSEDDNKRISSKSKSGFGRKVSNWIGKRKVYPTNVLHLATECAYRNHSATFPINLPKWFIKLFTKKGDIVLDPFMGSGTTVVASMQISRQYIGIDINKRVFRIAKNNINSSRKSDRKNGN
ncbi:MAG: site-specific DNA-methyltransferase [Candidatus Omnitrophica bacterium]|nr:site-specific DNA-methyltransferase [Candidatus Omnitrophota bacterium]